MQAKHLNSVHPSKSQGSKKKVLNLAIFGSKSGSNLTAILCAQKEKPNIHVKVIVTDRKCNCQKIAQAEDIPLIYIPYQSIKKKHPNDYHEIYEEKLLEKLKAFKIDYIILAGYMRLIKSSILEAYQGKIINVHPADLTYLMNQKRVYVGSNAIKLALKDKRKRTRSSIIFIDKGVDTGPIFVSGPWVSYLGKYPIDDDSVAKHQERQKFASDHPALIRAIDLLRSKEVVIIDGRIYVDGNRLSLSGYEM